MTDKRKTLKAHWPPRRINTLTVTLPADLYAKIWKAAEAAGHSLNDEMCKRLDKE